ncbi:MAG: DNRLRE domain-containing protein [Planctomycetes bacterium]|nr:DNRLRE domain-containing protein [Planctomycetota bacterium]
MRNMKLTLTFALAALLCAAGPALAVNLGPTDDAYVWSDDGNGNHGGDNYMIVGEWDLATPYSTSRDYLMFDLSSIPAGQVITSATLHIVCSQLYTTTVNAGAHFLSDDTWDEFTITWNNAPIGFTAAATDTTTLAVGDNTWNVLSDVSTEYGTADQLYSVVVKLPTEGANADGAWLHSKEFSDVAERPYLEVDYQDGAAEPDKDYGDAPEGVLAYPPATTVGGFPTCITVGPAGYVEHGLCWAHFEMIPPPGFDFEIDGNGGMCPMFAPYDNDECFMDGDAGLIMPDPYTIQAGTIVACPNGLGTALGQTGSMAVWGANVDIFIINNMPVMGYVNVLIDSDQNGAWGVVNEHVLVNWIVPIGFTGPLSALVPPPFTIGPNSGFAWSRFMISEAQVAIGWDGSGIFEDGETEDYLLRIDTGTPPDADWGDAPDGAAALGYPTLAANTGANHTIDLTMPWLGTQLDVPDAEADGQPDATATGDDVLDGNDDENGVVFPPLVSGATVNISVDVWDPSGAGGSGFVEIWIDYDISTSWEVAELVYSGFLGHGNNTVPITVPTGLTAGQSFARCRISSAGTGSVLGNAPDGEVEDYEIMIEPEEDPDRILKFQQLPLNGPEYFGHDELSTLYTMYDDVGMPVGYDGCYMADDFADLKSTPVINVKWWGSYLENEIMEPVTRFLIAFERDIPAVGDPGDIDYVPSHPGEVIQSEIVNLGVRPLNPGEYTETLVGPGGAPCYEALFEYEAELKNPFPQEPDKVYWIKIVAMIDLDYMTWQQIQMILIINPGLTLCDFLNLPAAEQQQLGLEMPITRWGWHNRDYTINDPYASVAPAVNPGERIVGQVIYPDSNPRDVWHFQDDAVSGYLMVNDQDPENPFVDQQTWQEEYYVYSLPYCASPPPGVDGPDEIATFSKDLAFELWTNIPDCYQEVGRDITHPGEYADWVSFGKPDCWCYPRQCHGDADGKSVGSLFAGYTYVNTDDLNIMSAGWLIKDAPHGPGIAGLTGPNGEPAICADFDRAKLGSPFAGYTRINTIDLNLMSLYYLVKEPPKGTGTPPDCLPGNRTP